MKSPNSLRAEFAALIILVLVAYIGGSLLSVPFIVIGYLLESPELIFLFSILGVQLIGFVGAGVLYLKKFDSEGLDALHFELDIQGNIITTLITTVLAISLAIGVSILALEIGIEPAENQIGEILEGGQIFVIMFIVLSVTIIGPAEEFLFRGVIQHRFGKYLTPKRAIILTSIVFALIHIPSMISSTIEGFGVYLTVLFFGSIIFGYAYEDTKNLLVPMVAHGLYNAFIAAPLLFMIL